jgi:eukaryotic-like serine/threonine-protein kinase
MAASSPKLNGSQRCFSRRISSGTPEKALRKALRKAPSNVEDFVGKYRLIRTLGKGATATVYLAEDTETQAQYALKVIKFDDDGSRLSRRFRKLFQTEAQLAERLNHPNITKVYDWKLEQDRAYLVMEFVDGKPLSDFTRIDKLLPMYQVVGIVFKCAMALDYAHRQGVVHRDIKPANVLIGGEFSDAAKALDGGGEKFTVKITDLGLALNTNKQVEVDSTFINGLGSPAYMSPEQIKGYQLNGQTDLYALGVMFYQLLTGRLPFRANNPASLVYKIVNTDAQPPTQLNTLLPKETDPIIKKTLEKDLYSRYRNGAQLAQDLSNVRYQLFDDKYKANDDKQWRLLRGQPIFNGFDDVEIWELLRISVFRKYTPDVILLKQDSMTATGAFGMILEGQGEVVRNGKAIGKLGQGDLVGEMAYLDPEFSTRSASVVTRSDLHYVEINAAALAFASEELRAKIDKLLTVIVVRRLRFANKRLEEVSEAAAAATEAEIPVPAAGGLKLELAPEDAYLRPSPVTSTGTFEARAAQSTPPARPVTARARALDRRTASAAEPIFVGATTSNTQRRLPSVEMPGALDGLSIKSDATFSAPAKAAPPQGTPAPAAPLTPAASAPPTVDAVGETSSQSPVTATGAQPRVDYAPRRMLERGAQKIAAAAGVTGEAPETYPTAQADLKTMPMSAVLALSRTKAPVDEAPEMVDMLATSDIAAKFLTSTSADRSAFAELRPEFSVGEPPHPGGAEDVPHDLMSTSDMAAKFMGTAAAEPFTVLPEHQQPVQQEADLTGSDHIPPEFLSTTAMAAKTSFGGDDGADDMPAEMMSTTAMAAKYMGQGAGSGSAFDQAQDEDAAMEGFANTQQMPGGFVKAAKHADPDGPSHDFITPFDLGDVKPVAKPTFDNMSRTQGGPAQTGQYLNVMGGESGFGKTSVMPQLGATAQKPSPIPGTRPAREEDGATEMLPGGFAGTASPSAKKPTTAPATTNTGSPIKLTQDMLAPLDIVPKAAPRVPPKK